MTSPIPCMPQISSCEAVSTLVMDAIKRETTYAEKNGNELIQDVMLFNKSGSMVDIKAEYKLNDVMKFVQDRNFGTTDCAQPMIKALQLYKDSYGKKGLYDVFIVYTDNETYCGTIHPSVALEGYRKVTGINSKMIVVATTPTLNTIGYRSKNILIDTSMDPNLTLNIAGFDLNAPSLIRNFINGQSDIGDISDIDE
jgi:60 kDa SS-A/Ro ribonucleoprotein